MSDIASVLVAVLSSNVIVELIRWIVGRSKKSEELDKKFEKIDDNFKQIGNKLTKYEKDGVRTQLLTLMSDYPDRKDEIMEVSKHYFDDLQGNWFMTDIFNDWLKENDIDKPKWIK